MKQRMWFSGLALVMALAFAPSAQGGPLSASVFLDGGSFIQSGIVTNNSDGGLNIVEVIYSLGTAADGIATWENWNESPAGFVRSGALTDGAHYQTISWAGLAIAPGGTFSFSGLDIDLIVALSPLNVTGVTLGGPSSLANAYFSVVFGGGGTSSASLIQQNWTVDQRLTLGAQASVPDAGSTMLLLGAALAGLAAFRRSR